MISIAGFQRDRIGRKPPRVVHRAHHILARSDKPDIERVARNALRGARHHRRRREFRLMLVMAPGQRQDHVSKRHINSDDGDGRQQQTPPSRRRSSPLQPLADPRHRLAHFVLRAGIREADEVPAVDADRNRRPASRRHAPLATGGARNRNCRRRICGYRHRDRTRRRRAGMYRAPRPASLASGCGGSPHSRA